MLSLCLHRVKGFGPSLSALSPFSALIPLPQLLAHLPHFSAKQRSLQWTLGSHTEYSRVRAVLEIEHGPGLCQALGVAGQGSLDSYRDLEQCRGRGR